MCGRYFIAEKDAPEEMQAILDALNRRNTPAKTGEIFPSDGAAVIANTKRLTPAPFVMRWGYEMESRRRVINARSETAAGKPHFAGGMRTRRCLVPASGYFEWARRSREKTKYEISDAFSPMLYMAGIYRLTAAGTAEFAILTKAPEQSVAFLHDRMPVILPRRHLADWLNPQYDAEVVLARANAALLAAPVSGQAETISLFDTVEI